MMTYNKVKDVKPLQMEIKETQKLIDDMIWDDLPCVSLQAHLDHLYDLDLKGEEWYCNF
jgi:hypothetical protein